MKIKKLDRRHHGYSSGWRYAIQFTHREWRESSYRPYNDVLNRLYGADMEMNPDWEPGNLSIKYWILNDNWRRDAKRHRIYLKKESDITLVTLML